MENCNQDVFENGVSIGLFDISKEDAGSLCKSETERTGRLHDWHYMAGRVHVKAMRETIKEIELVQMNQDLLAALEQCAKELTWMIDQHNEQSMEDGSWLYDHQTTWEAMQLVGKFKGGAA